MKAPCEHRSEAVGQFWCSRFGKWFLTGGFECRRCRGGLPVTTEAYRRYLAGEIKTEEKPCRP